jgi:hypothetical protein
LKLHLLKTRNKQSNKNYFMRKFIAAIVVLTAITVTACAGKVKDSNKEENKTNEVKKMGLEGKTAGRTRLFTKWFPIRFVRMAGFYKREWRSQKKKL